MFQRLSNLFTTLVCFAFTVGVILALPAFRLSAATYTVPNTAGVTVSWEENDPAPEGYRIYQRKQGEVYDYDTPCWTGSETSGNVYNLDWETTYYFVVRAYDGAMQSPDSQEVSCVTPTIEPVRHTIMATAGEHGILSPNGEVVVIEGTNQTFAITPDAGHHIADVTIDGVSQGAISSYTFDEVTENHAIEATFAIDTYVITATAGPNGEISPSDDSIVTDGDHITFSIIPAVGYHVSGLFVDGTPVETSNSYIFTSVDGNHTIHAAFEADFFEITATSGGNGTIMPAETVAVSNGGHQPFSFTPDPGFHISDVVVDGESLGAVASYVFDNVNENHTISVSFSESSPVNIIIEAEDGDMQWPMEIADDEAASHGSYIWVPSGNGSVENPLEADGCGEFHFAVPEEGEYRIWARQSSNETQGDSFFVSVDDANEVTWYTKHGEQENWTWDVVSIREPEQPRNYENPVSFHLSAGTHRLSIKHRDDGTRLDKLFITNQKDLIPSADGPISPTNWTLLYVDSEEVAYEYAPAAQAFDGDPNTFWHTKWSADVTDPPHEIWIDLGETVKIGGFRYLPRQDGSMNGSIGEYAFYATTEMPADASSWGEPVARGEFAGAGSEHEILFSSLSGRYVRLVALTEINARAWTSVAELTILREDPPPDQPQTGDPISPATWTLLYVDSEEVMREYAPAVQAFDGDPNTFWHTKWSSEVTHPPHEIWIDFGEIVPVGGFRYLPRQDGSTNGTIGEYAFYVTQTQPGTASSWGDPVAQGVFANGNDEKEVRFTTIAGRYVRLVALTEVNANAWTSVAEMTILYGDPLPVQPQTGDPISPATWTLLYVDSEEVMREYAPAVQAFDGDPNTFWHTKWSSEVTHPPHEIWIDFGEIVPVGGFRYLPRQDGSTNGTIGEYAFYVTQTQPGTASSWGDPVAQGVFANGNDEKEVRFTTIAGRYVRLVALTEVNANAWTSVAEIAILAGTVP